MLLELILFSVISALFVSLVFLFIKAKGEVPAPKPKVETPKAPKPKKIQAKKVEQPVTKTQPRKAVQEKEEVPSEDEFDIEDNEEDSFSGMNGFGVLTTKKAKKVEEVKPKPKAKEAEKPKEKPKQEKAADKPKAKEAEKPKAKEAEKPKAKEAEKPKAKEAEKGKVEKPKAGDKAPKAEGKPKKEAEQKKPKEFADEKNTEEVPVEKKKRDYKGDFVLTPYKTEEEFWNATFERPQKPEVKEEQKPEKKEKKEKKNQEKKPVIVEKKAKTPKNVQKNEATINNVGSMGWINEETGAEESNTQIEGYFPTLDSADKVNTKKRQPEQAFEIEMQAPADKVRKTEAKAEESSPASLETKQ